MSPGTGDEVGVVDGAGVAEAVVVTASEGLAGGSAAAEAHPEAMRMSPTAIAVRALMEFTVDLGCRVVAVKTGALHGEVSAHY